MGKNSPKELFYIILVSLLVTLPGCNSNTHRESTLIEAQFNIDTTLLSGTAIVDSSLNYSLRIPKGWQSISPELTAKLKTSMLVQDYADAGFEFGFINPKDSSMLVCLDVSKMEPSVFSGLRENYLEVLNLNNAWNQIQYQEFKYKSFMIDQYVLQNDEILNFKLICRDHIENADTAPKIELLYFINAKGLAENIKAIESSIGSLSNINH